VLQAFTQSKNSSTWLDLVMKDGFFLRYLSCFAEQLIAMCTE
jgi:hypothetical protein